jgi:outer membrane autotransporter protein
VQQTLAGPPPSTVNIDTSLQQHTFALLGGADFAPTGADDGVRFGVFGGYETSSLNFSSYGASADYAGGSLGAYAAYTNGGFYIDAEAKADLLNVTYRAPFTPAFQASGFATSLGVLANTGYRMETGPGFFEPLASLSFVSTSVDGFSAGGASVDFNNGQSLQAGAGIRVGTTFATPKETTTEVALLAKVSNEFNTANQVTISDGLGGSATFSDNISGVFGELNASATAYSSDRSFSAFVSAGGKFNADFKTIDAKAGVRKTF